MSFPLMLSHQRCDRMLQLHGFMLGTANDASYREVLATIGETITIEIETIAWHLLLDDSSRIIPLWMA